MASSKVMEMPQEEGARSMSGQGSGRGNNEMNPGDEAPPGTPGTAEDICPECSGTGRVAGSECPKCGGTGKIIEGIGGG
jgi:DnaJ-class molecular chaperone